MENIKIREAELKDLDTLLEFEQGVIEAERPFDAGLKPDPINYYDIEQLVASPDVRFAVAEVDGKPVGCGYARIEEAKPYLQYDRQSYLGLMYVLPDFRRRGINNLILDDLYRWALSKGVTDICLEVYPDNTSAVRAYEKAGFSPYLLQMQATIGIRTPHASEINHLAKIWYDGLQDAHAAILPHELRDDRTLESFRERLPALLDDTRAIGPPGIPYGFCTLKNDELYQLYLSAGARGTGAAQMLMNDAESRLKSRGFTTAWLACAIGNDRAARFYEKCGWSRIGIVNNPVQLASGPFDLDVWRYEKDL
ncbi:MAG: GNAT family N-acetyltransferase [Pyrinomonadaceae bacterium]